MHIRVTEVGVRSARREQKTKGESIEYQPPKLTREFLPRDYDGDWKRTANSEMKIYQKLIETWFDQAYEKEEGVPPAGGGTK
ncbi:hypothetical protein P7H21_19645 [Paenibacillus larvae]|nr:hypothetical protein [Paenibacillus larvae]MDT2305707.1 hypothetical protein [Paenibacillus larvae]